MMSPPSWATAGRTRVSISSRIWAEISSASAPAPPPGAADSPRRIGPLPAREDGRRGDALQPQNKSGFLEIRGPCGAVLQPLRLDVARAGFDYRAKMDGLPDSSATTPTDWLLRVGRLTDTAEDLLGGLC